MADISSAQRHDGHEGWIELNVHCFSDPRNQKAFGVALAENDETCEVDFRMCFDGETDILAGFFIIFRQLEPPHIGASHFTLKTEVTHLLRVNAAKDRRRVAGQRCLCRWQSADLPHLLYDPGEEERREAVLRLLDREKREARSPELLLIERGFLRGLREHILLAFYRRRWERDIEEGALAVAEIGERTLLPCFVRKERELGLAYQLVEAAFDQAQDGRGIRICLMDLRPASG